MLVDITSGREITKMPFEKDFDAGMRRLTSAEIDAMRNELNAKISGNEIHTAGWMPGSDWTHTPFQALYEKAARRNYSVAAKLFGLLVWSVFMEHPDRWGSGRYQKDGRDIGSRTYFKLE